MELTILDMTCQERDLLMTVYLAAVEHVIKAAHGRTDLKSEACQDALLKLNSHQAMHGC